MRPLQCKSQLLLGEGMVIMRLNAVVMASHAFVERVAEVSWRRRPFVQRALARKRVSLVRLNTWHSDWTKVSKVFLNGSSTEDLALTIENVVISLLLLLGAQSSRYSGVCGVVVGLSPWAFKRRAAT
jgi:hypothetical protein